MKEKEPLQRPEKAKEEGSPNVTVPVVKKDGREHCKPPPNVFLNP
jgi:hypothetical protein